MKIAIATDHAAVEVRKKIVAFLEEQGHMVTDLGPETADSVDYPDYAAKVARRVAEQEADFGILLCGTGIGMSITANKIKTIRAALCHSVETARLAREHNDANVLCLGARLLDEGTILDCVKTFLATAFEGGGRHERRVAKINEIERG
ncbi:MAG: ribose 5-phosphate isomerase B [Planctomycetes bacterium]|nr:ribose 5-phosphate isomerase B [Planctomycetota bacterium]